MIGSASGLFTVGVFQDVAWAEKGLRALINQGLPLDTLSVLAKDSPEVAALIERVFGAAAATLEIRGLGLVRARGPIVEALQGSDGELTRHGVAATARRIGFQTHDGRIFDTLTSRGGVLVSVTSDPRAADALAILHSYGGGNAAIGAWSGRV
ncbi:MAG TPA: hypothetical protein VGQ10_09825 [Vicinamibacterales bacterium]|jgi:hypothetical protein|nr:hypothetical protein [Vicinamibacterales bacterium]